MMKNHFKKPLTKGQIEKFAIEELTLSRYECWPDNNRGYGVRGFRGKVGKSDIIGYSKDFGIALYCEVKTATDYLSEGQIEFLNAALAAGCHIYIATDDNGYLLRRIVKALDMPKKRKKEK
jgi:hypothetical protein